MPNFPKSNYFLSLTDIVDKIKNPQKRMIILIIVIIAIITILIVIVIVLATITNVVGLYS